MKIINLKSEASIFNNSKFFAKFLSNSSQKEKFEVTSSDSSPSSSPNSKSSLRSKGLANSSESSPSPSSRLLNVIRGENGSALVEFLILGLPLFLPLTIFLGSIYESSHSQYDLENFSRQLARAYVTSPDEVTAVQRIQIVEDEFQNSLLKKDQFSSPPSVEINCSRNPCLSKGAQVEVKVSAYRKGTKVRYESRTREAVDNWRD